MREMRKDFIGEGRMFMIYKRLYKEFYVKQGVIIAPTKDNIFSRFRTMNTNFHLMRARKKRNNAK